MNQHVMLDLETMGTGNNAAIISIGAVKFDPYASTTDDAFHVRVDLTSSMVLGGEVSGGTIDWWMAPERHAARKKLLEMEPVDLASALDGFAQWFGNKSLPVWGNGAAFDNVILRNAFRHIGRDAPWGFHDDRCYRTLKNLVGPDCPQPLPVGVGHDALSDATWQALYVQNIVNHLRLKL